jgi:hypothetical protein
MSMATIGEFMEVMRRCADRAVATEPDASQRARHFIARLSGALESMGEQELADKVFSVLDHKEPL